MITDKILLEGLDCPNCGQKIADRVSRLEGVSSSELDFVNKKLVVVHSSERNELLGKIESIVHKLEPDVNVRPFEEASAHTALDGEKEEGHAKDIIRLCAAGALFAASFVFHFADMETVSAVLAVCAYAIAGIDVLISAVRNLVKGEAFDESLLMTIATVGALALKDFRESAAVMLFFQIGELFQDIAVEHSRKSITKLMELKPEKASLIKNGEITEVSPEEVSVGDIIVVGAGERIPLDGVVCDGCSELDVSALTGEFLPVEVSQNSEVMSGSTNLRGTLNIRVTNEYQNSAVAKILDMVQNSTDKKAKTEKFITRFARVYTPAVVAAALLLVFIPSIVTGFAEFSKWLYRGLLFLVISCPCALVISVPLSFFAGIGGASKKGILIKGAKNLETLAKCRTLAVDKTGTLTKGKFTVTDIRAEGVSADELLELAAYCEYSSTHPIGVSIVTAYGKDIDINRLKSSEEIAGLGVSCTLDGRKILCGKRGLLEQNGINVPTDDSCGTAVYVSADGKFAGVILLGDEIRETSANAVKVLASQGVETVLLTGDKKSAATVVAEKLGIRQVYSELLPQNKVEKVEELILDESKRLVAFAGDGINDAPVIARADIGIAMGGLGSDIAIEAADVVLMNDDPESISSAITIARKTMVIVRQNIVFALGVKGAVMLLGALGIAGMWAAVFADVGVSVIAVLNALRSQRT